MTLPSCDRCGQPHRACHAHRKHDGQPCGGAPLTGATLCRKHLTSPKGRANAAVRAEVLAWRLDAQTADPAQTLLRLLTQSAARAALYSALLEEQVALASEAANPDRRRDDDTDDLDEPRPDLGGAEGLIGHTIGAVKNGDSYATYATGEELRGLVRLEAEERDRCARFAKLALDAGIAERLVQLEEGKAALVVAALRAGLLAAGVPHNDPRVSQAITSTLRELENTA